MPTGQSVARPATRRPKTARDDVKLRRFLAARRRFDMAHGREALLQAREHVARSSALKHLGDEGTAGSEHPLGKIESRFRQRHDAQMVGGRMAGGRVFGA